MGLDAGFLSLLEGRAGWEAFTGEDRFGNDTYAPLVTIECVVNDMTTNFGAQDGQGTQDAEKVTGGSLLTDYKGIAPKDRLTVNGRVLHVTSVDTGHDETGLPLYQTVTVTSTPRA